MERLYKSHLQVFMCDVEGILKGIFTKMNTGGWIISPVYHIRNRMYSPSRKNFTAAIRKHTTNKAQAEPSFLHDVLSNLPQVLICPIDCATEI